MRSVEKTHKHEYGNFNRSKITGVKEALRKADPYNINVKQGINFSEKHSFISRSYPTKYRFSENRRRKQYAG